MRNVFRVFGSCVAMLLVVAGCSQEKVSGGAALYSANCANCHGRYADGQGPAAADLAGGSSPDLRYLATRSGDTQIYPADLPDRATVNWLLDAIATYLRPALLPIEEAAFGLRAGAGLGAEPPAADGGQTAFAAALPKLERFQGLLDDATPWACCGRFTIADVAATPVLHRLRSSGLPLTAIPRLAAWAGACCERPAWAGVAETAGV